LSFDASGRVKPWTPWIDALDLEMKFYRRCPADHGYPRFVYMTFLDGSWTPIPHRTDSIPATQIGMGILSYLKYHELRGKQDSAYLSTACSMGDYLVKESLTPKSGRYPAFTRSTGNCEKFPQPADAGAQADRPFEIEPDKGGIAGYALVLLFHAVGEGKYLEQGLQNARVLAGNQQDGDAFRSPWPFRADYRSGEGRGPVSGNMTYVLRLYDALLAQGYEEFAVPRRSLWTWIKRYQIPSAAADGALFAQFFEDHEWREDSAALIDFVRKNFTHTEYGVTVCHEQDEDKQAWGGILSTYGAVLALHAKATGSAIMAGEARQALDLQLYTIDELGRPRDLIKSSELGGWQEDAHTDVIHNYADALGAFPDWGR